MAESNGILDGALASASNEYGGAYPASEVLDGNISTFWHTDGVGVPHWIKFDLGSGNAQACSGEYSWTPRDSGDTHSPTYFLLQGSNNDSDWDTLDTQEAVGDWANGTKKTFYCTPTSAYRYWRFWVTHTLSDTYCCAGEIGIVGATGEQANPPVIEINVEALVPTCGASGTAVTHIIPVVDVQVGQETPTVYQRSELLLVASSADDGCWYASSFVGAGSMYFGKSSGNSYNSFWRFLATSIPQYAEIKSCVLKLNSAGTGEIDGVNGKIYFNAVDDAVAPTSAAEGDALALTSGGVEWNAVPFQYGDTWYDTPELKTELQQIVNRENYSPGNALQVVIKDNGSTDFSLRSYYNWDTGTKRPAKLYVVWGAGTEPIPTAEIIITPYPPSIFDPTPDIPVVDITIGVPQLSTVGDTACLLLFNTTPGTDEIIDEAGNLWEVVHVASPEEDIHITSDSPFAGMGSLYFPNAVNYIKCNFSQKLTLHKKDFTWECWHKSNGWEYSTGNFWLYNGDPPTWPEFAFQVNGSYGGYLTALLHFGKIDSSPDYLICQEFQAISTSWRHAAVVRRGNTLYAFDHGVLVNTKTVNPESDGDVDPYYNGVKIGTNFTGWLSGIKLTTGFGKWTSNFAVPTTPPVFDEGLKIYAQSSVDAFANVLISSEIPTWNTALSCQPPTAEIEIGAENPAMIWNLPPGMRPSAKVVYTCTLTGAPDGVEDIDLPMSSFIARARNGDPSYLSCVIPNSLDYEAEITARANGEMVIKKGYLLVDGTINMAEILRVDYESLMIDRGARNDSATIVGHKTITAISPKEVTVDGVSYFGLQANGKRRIRAAMNMFLQAGDTIFYGTDEADFFLVGSISYAVDVRNAFMEVTEE